MKLFFLVSIILFSISGFSLVKPWKSSLPAESTFVPSEKMQDRVDFWTLIYARYTSKQGVFHLSDQDNFVLGDIDFSDISARKDLNIIEKTRLAEKRIQIQRDELAKKWKISQKSRIRLQTGLKDRMEKALFLSGRYLPMMEKIFKDNNVPAELTRLVFVESSFNILAQSKVGASGLWQIMPSVARPHGYITQHYDKRNHPKYATELAVKILKQNYKSLGSWPLAVTAYNHGLTGVKRMMARTDSDFLEDLIDAKDVTPSWGVASKNFYACLLAVLAVERSAQDHFGDKLMQSVALNVKDYKLKKQVKKKSLLKLYSGSVTRFRQLNPHLNWRRISKNQKVPAGTPLVIPKEKFHLVAALK